MQHEEERIPCGRSRIAHVAADIPVRMVVRPIFQGRHEMSERGRNRRIRCKRAVRAPGEDGAIRFGGRRSEEATRDERRCQRRRAPRVERCTDASREAAHVGQRGARTGCPIPIEELYGRIELLQQNFVSIDVLTMPRRKSQCVVDVAERSHIVMNVLLGVPEVHAHRKRVRRVHPDGHDGVHIGRLFCRSGGRPVLSWLCDLCAVEQRQRSSRLTVHPLRGP